MVDLNIGSIQPRLDGGLPRLAGKTEDGREVLVVIRSNQGLCQVAVRVGWFGDEPLSRALIERVAVRLGSKPPQAIPSTAPSAPSSNPYFSRDAVPDSDMLRDFVEAPYRDRVIP
jgi:hypothetical protein